MTNIIDLDITDSISVLHFEILTPQVAFGEDLAFTFTLRNTSNHPIRLDIRYEIGHLTAEEDMVYHLHKITTRKCPSGFLLYNHSHTILEDSIRAGKELFPEDTALSGRESLPEISPSDQPSRCRKIPCELRIVINGRRLISGSFEVLYEKNCCTG